MASVADGDHQAEKVKGFPATQFPAKQVGRLDVDTGIAAGDGFPARKYFFDDEAERQCGHPQVNAFDAQCRQPHDQPDCGGQARSAGQCDREGQAGVRQDRLRVGTDAEKGRVAQRKQTGKPDRQHQSESGDGVDQDESQLGQVVLGKQPRCCEQQQQQDAVPEHMAAMLGKIDVLPVVGLEDKSHVFCFSGCSERHEVKAWGFILSYGVFRRTGRWV